jgi:hypothetical protein
MYSLHLLCSLFEKAAKRSLRKFASEAKSYGDANRLVNAFANLIENRFVTTPAVASLMKTDPGSFRRVENLPDDLIETMQSFYKLVMMIDESRAAEEDDKESLKEEIQEAYEDVQGMVAGIRKSVETVTAKHPAIMTLNGASLAQATESVLSTITSAVEGYHASFMAGSSIIEDTADGGEESPSEGIDESEYGSEDLEELVAPGEEGAVEYEDKGFKSKNMNQEKGRWEEMKARRRAQKRDKEMNEKAKDPVAYKAKMREQNRKNFLNMSPERRDARIKQLRERSRAERIRANPALHKELLQRRFMKENEVVRQKDKDFTQNWHAQISASKAEFEKMLSNPAQLEAFKVSNPEQYEVYALDHRYAVARSKNQKLNDTIRIISKKIEKIRSDKASMDALLDRDPTYLEKMYAQVDKFKGEKVAVDAELAEIARVRPAARKKLQALESKKASSRLMIVKANRTFRLREFQRLTKCA